jgi:hypothetical protein
MGVNGGIGFGFAANSLLRWEGELAAKAVPAVKIRQALAVTPVTRRLLLMPERLLKQRPRDSA